MGKAGLKPAFFPGINAASAVRFFRLAQKIMEKIKLVIFDLDGTLVDAYPAITESFNHVMLCLGLPPEPAAVVRGAVGRGDTGLLRPFVPKKSLKKALGIYRKHHARALRRKARLLPGAAELMAYLKKKGVPMAVASNRPTRFSRILIDNLALDGYFVYVLCADKLKKGKPDPLILRLILSKLGINRADALYVGDMGIDALTGLRAGVRTAIVLTGSGKKEEIKPFSPWKIVRSLGDLRKILTRRVGCYNIE